MEGNKQTINKSAKMSDEAYTEEITAPDEPQEINATKTSPKRTIISIIKSDPWYNDVSKIAQWKEPIKTGLIFGIINFFYLLHEFYDYTVLTLSCYLALALTLVCFSYANFVILKAKWIQGKQVENPFKERFKNVKFHISSKTVEQHLNTVVDLINLTMDNLRDVFYVTDNLLTLKWALYFYIGAYFGDWFGGATLLYLVTLVVFIWPRLYEEKQKEIDHYYGVALVEMDKYVQLGLTKLPPSVTDRFPMLLPRDKKDK